MTKIIESYAGDTQEVEKLRRQIIQALAYGPVKVHLWQPGIMYQQDGKWLTVVDFVNEWQGRAVTFYSNVVPLRHVNCPVRYVNDMFISGNRLYERDSKCRKILSDLRAVTNDRKLHWEFLFGQHKPCKDRLYEIFKQHAVAAKTLHTYFGRDPKSGIWSNGFVPKRHTAETIDGNENAFDSPVRHSDLIDPEIYNQSFYSVAIETVVHNDFAMFSEKEAKPIMAKRPFVIFGAHKQLEAFRKLGFKTFNDIIDESYDCVRDHDQRFIAMLDSMHRLCEYDPVEVYKILSPVLEHNKKHFLENNWTRV